jgi:hypothetical protein
VRGFLFQIITSIEPTTTRAGKAELPLQLEKGRPHNHVDLPPLVSVEATGVSIPVGNSEVLLAAVYEFPGHAWTDRGLYILYVHT